MGVQDAANGFRAAGLIGLRGAPGIETIKERSLGANAELFAIYRGASELFMLRINR